MDELLGLRSRTAWAGGGNDVWYHSESIATKVCTRSVANEMQPAPGKGICSDSNQSAQRLQMAARKSLEMMSGMIMKRLQPKFAVKSVANEMYCLKAV